MIKGMEIYYRAIWTLLSLPKPHPDDHSNLLLVSRIGSASTKRFRLLHRPVTTSYCIQRIRLVEYSWKRHKAGTKTGMRLTPAATDRHREHVFVSKVEHTPWRQVGSEDNTGLPFAACEQLHPDFQLPANAVLVSLASAMAQPKQADVSRGVGEYWNYVRVKFHQATLTGGQKPKSMWNSVCDAALRIAYGHEIFHHGIFAWKLEIDAQHLVQTFVSEKSQNITFLQMLHGGRS